MDEVLTFHILHVWLIYKNETDTKDHNHPSVNQYESR